MEMFDTSVTNGSNLTVSNSTGTSVIELITFAAFSWGSVVSFMFIGLILSCLTWQHWVDANHELDWCCVSSTCFSIAIGVILVVIAVTAAILLIVGSVLSTQNVSDDSTGALELSDEGLIGRVLLIVTESIPLLVWIFLFAGSILSLVCVGVACCSLCEDDSDADVEEDDLECTCKYACLICCCGCVLIPVSVTGVALLGWSSLNDSVTPELHTAGMVLSSVGLGGSFLVSVILGFAGCMIPCRSWIKDKLDDVKDKLDDVRTRRQKTKETEARRKLLESRQKKAKSLLEEALKRGFAECRTVVCLLVGVAGAGKTHTKHLLFRWAPPEFRNSTPLAVRPVQAIRVRASSQSGRLQEVDPDELDKILASTVASGVPMDRKNSLQNLCCIRVQKQTKSTGISPPSHSHENPTSKTPFYSIGKKRNSDNKRIDFIINPHYQPKKRSCCCCNCFCSDSELQQSTKVALKETTHQIAHTSQPQQHMNCDWIYLIDSGGQNEFLEVMPAFLQHTSVCLFVMKLSELLSECPKIEYFENGKPVGEPVVCPFTNEQMLMRCVQTIQTQCTHQDSSTNQESKLVMVGTHQDLAGQCKESIEEKNQTLHNKLCPEFDKSLIFHREDMRQLVFPINAKNPGPQDYEVANKITENIFNVVSSLKPRKTPISWFKFEQVIQKLCRIYGKRIMHWKECLQVARSLHLSAKDLNATLDHLANFGVIHYYWHLLPDIVFVDPQFLLDKISELVKYHYQLRHDPQPNTTLGGNLREFRNEGCITLELLKQFPEHYTDFFTAADFLKLINDRLIVTQHIGSGKYFMPCLLRTMKPEEVDHYRVTASGVAPLAIHFSSGWVPHGVFCSLVAFLRSSQNSSPWKLYPRPNDRSTQLCLTRNCIKFQFPEDAPGSLTLIDAFSHFEVYVDAPYDVCARLCLSIQQTLFRGIQKAAETYRYEQLVPKLAFLCKHGNNRPHLALPAAALDYWKCQYEPDIVYGRLMKEHMVWHPDKGLQTEETPTAESSLWSRITTSLYRKVQRTVVPKQAVQLPVMETGLGVDGVN